MITNTKRDWYSYHLALRKARQYSYKLASGKQKPPNISGITQLVTSFQISEIPPPVW